MKAGIVRRVRWYLTQPLTKQTILRDLLPGLPCVPVCDWCGYAGLGLLRTTVNGKPSRLHTGVCHEESERYMDEEALVLPEDMPEAGGYRVR